MKKRFVAVFIIITCLAFLGTSIAEDEITFRNIPWGTDLQNAKEMIRQDNIDADADYKENYSPFGGSLVRYTTNNLNTLVPWFPEPKLWVTILHSRSLSTEPSTRITSHCNDS